MGYTKLKGFCLANELTNKLKSQPILWFKKEKKTSHTYGGKGYLKNFRDSCNSKERRKYQGI